MVAGAAVGVAATVSATAIVGTGELVETAAIAARAASVRPYAPDAWAATAVTNKSDTLTLTEQQLASLVTLLPSKKRLFACGRDDVDVVDSGTVAGRSVSSKCVVVVGAYWQSHSLQNCALASDVVDGLNNGCVCATAVACNAASCAVVVHTAAAGTAVAHRVMTHRAVTHAVVAHTSVKLFDRSNSGCNQSPAG